MSSQIRNANPVKVNPSMIAKANDFNANPVKVNPSMIAKANDFTVPAKSPERQKSSLDRTCASILKMTKAEYEVFKEKYTDENGSFDSSALERAARNNSVATSTRFTKQLYPEMQQAPEIESRAINKGGVPFGFHSDDQGRYPVFIDNNNDARRAQSILEYMKSGHYIDLQTNTISIKFMTYNGNTGFFGLVKVSFIYAEDGQVSIDENVRIVDVNTFNATPEVAFRFFLEILFAILMLFEFITEVRELYHAKVNRGSFLLYFQSLWNYIDVTSIFLQFFVIAKWYELNVKYLFQFAPPRRFEVYHSLSSNARYLYTGSNMTNLATSQGLENLRKEMNTLEAMATMREQIRQFNVICVVLATMRLIKLLDFQPKLGLVTRTIAKAKNDLFHFLLILLTILLVYAVCGLVIFGEICESFSEFGKAFETVVFLFTQANVETIHYEMIETSMDGVSITVLILFYSLLPTNVPY